jgi:hypothetical protein
MALATYREEPTSDSPSAFFEAMDYTTGASTVSHMLNYNLAPDFNNPFKPTSKMNGQMNPLLSNNQLNLFNLDNNFWNDPSQFGVLETINPALSPLGGNQSCDTGYVSQEGSSAKSPQVDENISTKQTDTTSNSRKRSSTKNTNMKAEETKPTRKSRRTSKAPSVNLLLDDEEDDTKRERFLARNREAASKCRQKKKEWAQDLEQKARDLSSQKQMLITYLAMLKNELLMLKCKCLEHSDCGCEGIRDYIKNTVNTMPPTNAPLDSKLENNISASKIAAEIARKQSSASAFDMDAMSTEAMSRLQSRMEKMKQARSCCTSVAGDNQGPKVL